MSPMRLRVLTIDGGGMRGIIPAAILVYLEGRIKEISKKPNARLIDCFDFIAGTSSGSVTAIAMILPTEKGKQKSNMNNVLDLYLNLSQTYFDRPLNHKLKTFWGWFGPTMPAINAERVYLNIFDHYKMSDLIKPCLIPAYDILDRSITLYNREEHANFFVKDVIRGSHATPGMFEPAYFRNGMDKHVTIDGGTFANNPALITFTKLLELNYQFKDMFIISLGTGKDKNLHYQFETAKRWGKIGWMQPYIDIVKTSNIEVVERVMTQTFINNPNQYIRINPTLIKSSRNLHEFSQFNIDNLLEDAADYIKEHKEELDALAQRLYDCK